MNDPTTNPSRRALSWKLSEACESLTTAHDLLRFCHSRLAESALCFRSGMGSAAAEASFLLHEALALEPGELVGYEPTKLLAEERIRVLEALKERLETHKPMAYILGVTWYCGLRLCIDERALIPRSAIGTMLEDRFELEDPAGAHHILDLGTGSGAIALAFAASFPESQVIATELSAAALAVARQNVQLHGLERRIELRQSDVFSALYGETFDWILCNPPYVSEDFREHMSQEYRYEPAMALFGGVDGLDLPRRLLRAAAAHLRPGGRVFMELGDITSARFAELTPGLECDWWCHPESGEPVVVSLDAAQATVAARALDAELGRPGSAGS